MSTQTEPKVDAASNGTAPERARPRNVIEALARVMEELPGIGKGLQSPQGYQYRGIEQITQEAQKLLGRYGVVFVPKVLDRRTVDLTVGGKPWTEEQLLVEYAVYGPGGVEDRITVGPLWGLGRDNSDKGANKSMTQAYKYALIQTLCIGDHKDDPDGSAAAEADAPAADHADWFRKNGWDSKDEHDGSMEALRSALRSSSQAVKGALGDFALRLDNPFRWNRAVTRAEFDALDAEYERLRVREDSPPAPIQGRPEFPPRSESITSPDQEALGEVMADEHAERVRRADHEAAERARAEGAALAKRAQALAKRQGRDPQPVETPKPERPVLGFIADVAEVLSSADVDETMRAGERAKRIKNTNELNYEIRRMGHEPLKGVPERKQQVLAAYVLEARQEAQNGAQDGPDGESPPEDAGG